MPVVDDFPQRPQSGPPFEDAAEGWALPLGTISGLRLYVSYSIFFAAAVVCGAVWVVSGRPGNSDVVTIATIGLAFWCVGWLVQVTVYAFARFAFGAPIESVTVGLLGVESRVRNWEARTAFLTTVGSILSVVLLGVSAVAAEQFVNGTHPWRQLLTVWTAPSFGLGMADHVWLAGAWLLWIQALCQLYPLPQATGRVVIVAAVSMLSQRLSEPFQTHFARRTLQLVAFVTALIAVATLLNRSVLMTQQWPIVMLIAVLLWFSARSMDVKELVLGFGSFHHWESDGMTLDPSASGRLSWIDRTKHAVGAASRRRRLRKAQDQEHREAADADRLDEVLSQLHQDGRDSLSDEDLALLQRVSDSLRRERERQSMQESD